VGLHSWNVGRDTITTRSGEPPGGADALPGLCALLKS
jgi:hypothetical protein